MYGGLRAETVPHRDEAVWDEHRPRFRRKGVE